MYLLKGNPMNGYWDEDTRKNRCILRCDSGYEPTGCHVIRYSHREGKGNHDIPICQKSKDMGLVFLKLVTPPPFPYKKQTHSFKKKGMS